MGLGLIYDPGDSDSLIRALRSNLKAAQDIIDRLSDGCGHLVDQLNSGSLSGVAYTAGKGLFEQHVIPTVSAVKQAIDGLSSDLKTYTGADENVRSYGRLEEEYIEQQIELKQQQVSCTNQLLQTCLQSPTLAGSSEFDAPRGLSSSLEELNTSIGTLQAELAALHEFDSATHGLFTDSLTILATAMKAVADLNQSTTDNDGNYYPPPHGFNWEAPDWVGASSSVVTGAATGVTLGKDAWGGGHSLLSGKQYFAGRNYVDDIDPTLGAEGSLAKGLDNAGRVGGALTVLGGAASLKQWGKDDNAQRVGTVLTMGSGAVGIAATVAKAGTRLVPGLGVAAGALAVGADIAELTHDEIDGASTQTKVCDGVAMVGDGISTLGAAIPPPPGLALTLVGTGISMAAHVISGLHIHW